MSSPALDFLRSRDPALAAADDDTLTAFAASKHPELLDLDPQLKETWLSKVERTLRPPPEPQLFTPPAPSGEFQTLSEPEASSSLGGMANSFLRSGQQGIGSTLKGLGTVAGAAPVEPPAEYPLPAELHERLLKMSEARAARSPGEVMREIQENPLTVAGQALSDVAPETHPVPPGEEKAFGTRAAGMAGSFVPLLASGSAAPLTIGLQSAGEHITSDYESGLKAGLSDDQAAELALQRSLASGTLQAGIFGALPKPLRSVAEKYLVGKFGQAGFARWLTGRLSAGGEGAVLGGTSKAAENVVEGQPPTAGTGESAAGLAAMNLALPWLREREGPTPEQAQAIQDILRPTQPPTTPELPAEAQPKPAPTPTPSAVSSDALKDLLAAMQSNQIKAPKPGETIDVNPATQPAPSETKGPTNETDQTKPAVQLQPAPGDASAQNAAEPAAQPEPTEAATAPPGDGQDVPAAGEVGAPDTGRKGKATFFIRPRSDGVFDVLDAIQDLGGLRPPGENAGGEYDGWKEAMQGTARLLVKRGSGNAPDTILDELRTVHGMAFENPDQMYDAIRRATAQRDALRTNGGGPEAQTERFWMAATSPKSTSGMEKVNVTDLKVGDTFRLRAPGVSHEELTVTHIDPDSGEVTVKDGTSFGIQDIPDGTEIWVRKGSRESAAPGTLREEPSLFGAPESVAEQKARLEREAAAREKAAQRDELERRRGRKLEGKTGDLGQRDMLGGDLFSEHPGDPSLWNIPDHELLDRIDDANGGPPERLDTLEREAKERGLIDSTSAEEQAKQREASASYPEPSAQSGEIPGREQPGASAGRNDHSEGEQQRPGAEPSEPAGALRPARAQAQADPLALLSVEDLRREIVALDQQIYAAQNPARPVWDKGGETSERVPQRDELAERLKPKLAAARAEYQRRLQVGDRTGEILRADPQWMAAQRAAEQAGIADPALRERVAAAQKQAEAELAPKPKLSETPPEPALPRYPEGEAGQLQLLEQPGGSIGAGMREAMEKNRAGEAGSVRLPSKEELLNSFTELPERFRNLWKYGAEGYYKIRALAERAGNRDILSFTKDAADNQAVNFGKQAGNIVLHELNRAFGARTLKGINERNREREEALTMVLESGAGVEAQPGQQQLFPPGNDARWNLVQMQERLLASDATNTIWGKRALRAIDFANRHWEQLRPIAEMYAALTDMQNRAENAAGYKTLYRQGGYVFHLQDLSKDFDFEAARGRGEGVQGAATPFQHIRDYQTYAEAIANGVNPRSLNAVDLLQRRLTLGRKLINYGVWMDSARRVIDPTTQMPLVTNVEVRHRADGSPDITAPPGYFKTNFGGQEIAVHSGYQGTFEDLTQGSWVRGRAWGRVLMEVAGTTKHATLLFDTFHLGRLAFWNSVARVGAPGYQRGLNLLDNTSAEIRQMVANGEVPREWERQLVEDKAKIDLLMRAGMNVGNIGDNLYTDWVQKTPGLGTFNKWLFERYQRGAMTEVGLVEMGRLRKMFPQESDELIARRAAKAINVRFGSLNSQSWIKSKTGQDLARMLFLAPQWNEGLIRAELGALRDAGMAPIESYRSGRPAMGMLARSVGAAVVGQFVANQLINYATRGHPTWENPEENEGSKISAWIPDVVGGGPGFFWNPTAIPAEISHLLMKSTDRTGDFSKALLQFATGRLNTLSKPIYTFVTRKDTLGRSLRSGADVGKTMLSEAFPAPISGSAIYRMGKQLATGQHEERFPGQFQGQMMQSLGLKTDKAPSAEQRIQALAGHFNRAKGIVPDAEWYAGNYVELANSLRLGNQRDAGDALTELLTKVTPRQVYDHFQRFVTAPFTGKLSRESEFFAGLNPEQKSAYDQAKATRRQVALGALQLLQGKARAGE